VCVGTICAEENLHHFQKPGEKNMLKGKMLAGGAAALAVAIFAVGTTRASTSATGSVTATPDGSNYLYTISLHNTGTTNIDTFWFSWLPDNYDFMDSVPTVTGTPANWTSAVETGYYGSSIQFYDTASSPIGPGQTSNAFQYESPDAPTVLAGDNFFGLPETYSYVYAGAPAGPLQDPVTASSVIFSMPVAVPEPAGLAVLGIAAMSLMGSRRRKPSAAIV
jgi:hypothetical protein